MPAEVDATAPPTGTWYRLRAFELATGLVLGTLPPVSTGPARPEPPGAVLERLVLAALRRPPCVVAFSGGRDSSAMLALAVRLARRDGLAPPVPVTRWFPGAPDADESQWQTRVIRHLGVDDWVRLEMSGECDLVGPLAVPLLRRHGLLWPPTVHVNVPLFEVAAGGTLLTGEGGDQVFGPHRVTPLLHLVRGGRRRRRGALRYLSGAVGPAALRQRHWRRHVAATDARAWLRADVRSAAIAGIAGEYVAEPLSWRAATVRLARNRSWVLGAGTVQQLADERDVRMCHPLLDPSFLSALAAAGSPLGPVSRAEAMRRLFSAVLPADVLKRRSKAYFNTTLTGAASRAFAEHWDGGGVDTRLVDPERLRHEWLGRRPHAGALPLLQAAWMSTRGWSLTGQQ